MKQTAVSLSTRSCSVPQKLDVYQEMQSMVQVRDAKASQLSAEQATNALRAELTQLSGQASAAQEMASMWQGRAEGIQQHLEQALPWQGRAEDLEEQLDQATARAESFEQQLAQAVQQTVALEKAGKDAAAAAAVQEDCIRQVAAQSQFMCLKLTCHLSIACPFQVDQN